MILIGMGANLPSRFGPPAVTLDQACAALDARGITILSISRKWGSPAWPPSDQPDFVNIVLHVATDLGPSQLLTDLQQIEESFGRKRGAKNAARILDLDLLAYHQQVSQGQLILPHPGIEHRAFVLCPLFDVAPCWRHPVSGKGIEELIAALPSDQRAWPLMMGDEIERLSPGVKTPMEPPCRDSSIPSGLSRV